MVYFFGKIDEMLDFEKESQENGAIGRGVFTKEEAEKIETVFLKHTELFRKAYSLLLE